MSHLIIGLMSGTSVDGIDAALIEIDSQARCLCHQMRLLEFATVPYPQGIREHILAISAANDGSTAEICRWNVLIGELFAQAAEHVIAKAGLKREDVALIGSHGQTIQHLPNPVELYGYTISATLQIGEPSVIAQRTGITTVADFRPADIAAGGQGAPLLPLLHYHLFKGNDDTIVQNIGGIGNLTFIPGKGKSSDVIAFDTGPGNMLLDGLIAYYSQGKDTYDRNGAWASRGCLCTPLLEELLQHPFFALPPPKTCGREEFGPELMQHIIRRSQDFILSPADVLQTVTAFTARSIIKAYQDFIFPKAKVRRILVCGGGRLNLTLMFHLQSALDLHLQPVEDYGINGDALEAMGFALLAYETMCGRPGNLPGATGAKSPVILGKVVWGPNYSYWQRVFSRSGGRQSSESAR